MADHAGDPDFWTLERADEILTGDAEDGSRKGTLRLLGSYDQQDMGESELLLGFMDAACGLFPAEHYWLIVWDHGNGAAEGVCASDVVNDGMDDQYYQGKEITGSMMTMAEMEEALHSSRICREAGGLDIVSLDCCMMGGIEVAYNLSPYARYLTASEEATYGHGDFTRYFGGFAAGVETPSAREIAVAVPESYLADHPAAGNLISTHACYDLQALRDFGGRMDRFGKAMSALIDDPDTGRETFEATFTAASRAKSFGVDTDTGEGNGYDYVDLYSMLKGLHALLQEKGQKAEAAGRTEAAGRYVEATAAIEDLYETPFIVYRRARMGNGYALEQTAPEGQAMTIEMTGAEYQNLWKFAGFGQISGVSLFVPYKIDVENEEVKSCEEYVDEAIFPAYAEFLSSYYDMLVSDWNIQALEAGSDANDRDLSRLFSGASTRRYAWTDEAGQPKEDIVLDVSFAHSDEEDLVASFLFGSSRYSVDVLRHVTVTSLETGEKKSADLLIGQSDEELPQVMFHSGELSCDADESGAVTVTDSSALTIDTALLNFVAYAVQGETADTDGQTLARDFATMDTFPELYISAFVKQSHTQPHGQIVRLQKYYKCQITP